MRHRHHGRTQREKLVRLDPGRGPGTDHEPISNSQCLKPPCSDMLCAVQDCAMGEAMMIAKKSGVDMKLLFDAMRISSGNSFCWETEFARVADGTYTPDFTAEMMAKDVELGQGLARRHGVPMLMHGQVAQIYEMCMARYGKDSGSTIPVKLIEDMCGTPLADEKLKAAFEDWTYTTEIVDGSYTIVHKNLDNPYSSISLQSTERK